MSDHTHIEWTDATWQPVTGCSVVSAGCKHCYAMRLAGNRLRHHPSRAGLTRQTSAGPVWTGEVRLNEQWLNQPLHWRTPRRIFVCAHGDLFHPAVPDEWLTRVFEVIRCCEAQGRGHIFQILTKRPARMLDIMRRLRFSGFRGVYVADRADSGGWPLAAGHRGSSGLPNVHLGVSVEDQAAADERIPILLQTPAAVRFVSIEPMLSAISFDVPFDGAKVDALRGARPGIPALSWVIAGGESGPGARPSHPDWFRALRDQCQAAGVPFFFKQWGEWAPNCLCNTAKPHVITPLPEPGKRGCMFRCGKRAAGRLLDGRTWSEYPAVAP